MFLFILYILCAYVVMYKIGKHNTRRFSNSDRFLIAMAPLSLIFVALALVIVIITDAITHIFIGNGE